MVITVSSAVMIPKWVPSDKKYTLVYGKGPVKRDPSS